MTAACAVCGAPATCEARLPRQVDWKPVCDDHDPLRQAEPTSMSQADAPVTTPENFAGADPEAMQRDLALAMGWTRLYQSRRLGGRVRWWGLRPGQERGAAHLAPDPLHSAEDAEALEAWLVGQGWELDITLGPKCATYRVWPAYDHLCKERCRAADEPDHARRRRRALCEAAWQALQVALP